MRLQARFSGQDAACRLLRQYDARAHPTSDRPSSQGRWTSCHPPRRAAERHASPHDVRRSADDEHPASRGSPHLAVKRSSEEPRPPLDQDRKGAGSTAGMAELRRSKAPGRKRCFAPGVPLDLTRSSARVASPPPKGPWRALLPENELAEASLLRDPAKGRAVRRPGAFHRDVLDGRDEDGYLGDRERGPVSRRRPKAALQGEGPAPFSPPLPPGV